MHAAAFRGGTPGRVETTRAVGAADGPMHSGYSRERARRARIRRREAAPRPGSGTRYPEAVFRDPRSFPFVPALEAAFPTLLEETAKLAPVDFAESPGALSVGGQVVA